MYLEFVDKFGGPPVRVPVSQVIVFNDQGTPVGVAGEYGPQGCVRVSHAAEPDFNQTLRTFGYSGGPVAVDRVQAPAAAGDRFRLPGT